MLVSYNVHYTLLDRFAFQAVNKSGIALIFYSSWIFSPFLFIKFPFIYNFLLLFSFFFFRCSVIPCCMNHSQLHPIKNKTPNYHTFARTIGQMAVAGELSVVRGACHEQIGWH